MGRELGESGLLFMAGPERKVALGNITASYFFRK